MEPLEELESYGFSRLLYNIMSFPLCLECSIAFCSRLLIKYRVLNCQPVLTTYNQQVPGTVAKVYSLVNIPSGEV